MANKNYMISIDTDIHKKAKNYAISNGMNLSALITVALNEYIFNHEISNKIIQELSENSDFKKLLLERYADNE